MYSSSTENRSCTRKISFEKSSAAFSLKIGGRKPAKVVQESEAFISNRVKDDDDEEEEDINQPNGTGREEEVAKNKANLAERELPLLKQKEIDLAFEVPVEKQRYRNHLKNFHTVRLPLKLSVFHFKPSFVLL